MTCPFCKGQVEVPKPHAPRRHPRYQRDYALKEDDPQPHGSLAAGGMLSEADIAALEEEDAPPKKRRRPKMEWRLFVGGFGFPWTQGAVMRWLLLALWATIAGWLAHAAVALGIGQALDQDNMIETIVAMVAASGAAWRNLLRCRRLHSRSDDPSGNDRRKRPHGELAERGPVSGLGPRPVVHL